MRAVVLYAVLFGFYVVLSGQIHNSFLMTIGLVTCAAVTWLCVHMGTCDEEGVPYDRSLGLLAYLPWLVWQVVLSNIDIARRVWSSRLPIDPVVLEAPHNLKTPLGIAVYANSITLTPGTVTIEAERGSFIVHGVASEITTDLQRAGGEMERRIADVEGSGAQ